MSTAAALELTDAESLADLGTYVTRAKAADPAGAVRLVVAGGVLAAYVCMARGHGLSGEGTVLGLRTYAVRGPATLDATVALAAVSDRTHRRGNGTSLPVPPVTVSAPWAGVAPPRAGWAVVARLSPELVHAVALGGAETVTVVPEVAVARALCRAAVDLGFVGRDPLTVHRSGRWQRLTSPLGHVLTR